MKKLILLAFVFAFSCYQLKAERDTLRIYFDSGTDEISGFQQSLIDIFATTHYAKGEIIVSGHTDDLGNALNNLEYSRNRATLVAEYLLSRGLSANKMLVEAWGETKPLLPNVSAYNRARNRRVEIIGIPKPEVTNLDGKFPGETTLEIAAGTSVRYRQMTTSTGNARRMWVVKLAKENSEEIAQIWSNNFFRWWRSWCGFRDYSWPALSFSMMIPTSENMRCPLSEINFEDEYYEVGKDRWQNPGTLLTPIKTDSGYSFSIILPGNEPSMPAKYALGNKCFTIDKAVVRLEKLKLSKLRGKIKSLDQKFDAKTIDETHFEVQFINEDPSTTQLFGTFIKGRRKQMNLTATPLSQLPKDEVSGEYVLDVKHLRKMNRRNNRK